jgi:hypothetical protein
MAAPYTLATPIGERAFGELGLQPSAESSGSFNPANRQLSANTLVPHSANASTPSVYSQQNAIADADHHPASASSLSSDDHARHNGKPENNAADATPHGSDRSTTPVQAKGSSGAGKKGKRSEDSEDGDEEDWSYDAQLKVSTCFNPYLIPNSHL